LSGDQGFAIELAGVTKLFTRSGREVRALEGVDLQVRRGEISGVLGPSGAGKSTLIRLVNGLERPTSGAVRVDGEDLPAAGSAALRERRRRTGMIFQHFNLLTSRTAAGNVALPLEVAGVSKRERTRRAHELLDTVGLREAADAYPAQLSGGQKQRVGIARALAGEPSVLLSDEATSALDDETTASVLDLLRELNERLGLTILLITHQLSVVQCICDSATLLRDGRVVDGGPLGEAVGSPWSPLGRLLLPSLPPHTDDSEPLDVVALDDLAQSVVDPRGADGSPVHDALERSGARIAAAAYETVGGRPVARLRVVLGGDDAQRSAAAEALTAAGAHPHSAPPAETEALAA
jgi:D-methionine transport system ATP-binding protein